MFINASSVNVSYQCVNKPIMFYVKGRGRQYCDVKSLLDEDDAKDNDMDKVEKEEDNPYKMREDYETEKDPNNQMEVEVDEDKPIENPEDATGQ